MFGRWSLKKRIARAVSNFGDGIFHSYTGSPINAQIRGLRESADKKPLRTSERGVRPGRAPKGGS